jgi:hypothetical protein
MIPEALVLVQGVPGEDGLKTNAFGCVIPRD